MCLSQGHLKKALRDQLVCGILSSGIQKRPLAEADLPYAKAVELALSMEVTDSNLAKLQQHLTTTVHSLNSSRSGQVNNHCKFGTESKQASTKGQAQSNQSRSPYNWCGAVSHSSFQCKFKQTVCHYHKKGHLAKVCRSKHNHSYKQQHYHHISVGSAAVQLPPDDQNQEGADLHSLLFVSHNKQL